MYDNDGSNDSTGQVAPVIAVVVIDTLTDKIVALITSKVDSALLFTAFDITREARSLNVGMDIPHHDVRDIVLAEFTADDDNSDFCMLYERTLTELVINQSSYVYHPSIVPATDYHLAVQPVAVIPTPTPASDDDSDLTVENRLNIPKPLLEVLGLLPGKMVRLDTVDGVMSITETTCSPYETLFVNTDGRLRLNANQLTTAFGSLPTKFDISVSSDGLTIKVKPEEVKPD
jgi:hypothetical protein